MDINTGRILDANFNRAREAIRVMEDYSRFALNDKRLCGALKDMRHKLAEILRQYDITAIMITRDTPGDVGTTISTESEYNRATTGEVVIAAGKRLSEALRVLEEFGKTINENLAKGIERIRYQGYDIEKSIIHLIQANQRLGKVKLYVLITEAMCKKDWRQVISESARGGADCFQLREKEMEDGKLLERAREFVSICRECSAVSIINDRADIALASGADGIHVGQDDIDIASARKVVGPHRIVGISTHSMHQALDAAKLNPDYIAVGPMFSTQLKPEYGVAGTQLLTEVISHVSLPVVGIGGIDEAGARDVAAAGGKCVAVCSAIIGEDDPERAASNIRKAFE